MTPSTPSHGINRQPITHLIFAGNFKEYLFYIKEHRIHPLAALFVTGTDTLHASLSTEERPLYTVFLPLFWKRSDARQLYDVALNLGLISTNTMVIPAEFKEH
jgi:hypothetical protein